MANKKEFTKEIASRSENLTRAQVEEALQLFEDVAVDFLAKGETVKLVGFVTFEPVPRAARQGFDPINEKTIEIPAKVGAKASAGSRLKDAVKDLKHKDFQPGGKHHKPKKK